MKSIQLALLAVCLASPALAQTTWFVDAQASGPGTGTASDPYSSIQFGMDQASTQAGDTLRVAFGEYDETLDYRGKAVTVEGQPSAGGQLPILRSPGASTVVFASGEGPGSVVKGLDIRGGEGTLQGVTTIGGNVLVRGTAPTLVDVIVRFGTADRGGGIAVIEGASPTFSNVVVRVNTSQIGGGVLVDNSSLAWTGGALRANDVYSGPAGGVGAGLAAVLSIVQLSDLLIVRNGTGSNPTMGGGLYSDAQSIVSVSSSELVENFSGLEGGGAYGPITLQDCLFRENRAAFEGGGSHGGILKGCTLRGNAGRDGAGAAYVQAFDCLFEENSSFIGRAGGAAFQSDLVDCVVQKNLAKIGGGLYGGSALRTMFFRNSANGSVAGLEYGWGGGAMSARLERCEFFENRATRGAGAWLGSPPVELPPASPGEALHCTFARNPPRATIPALGGGGLFLGPGSGAVSHCAFADNGPYGLFAPQGGTVEYCCLQEPMAGPGNFVADPELVGYLAYDAHLLAASPCIDAGDPSAAPDPDGSVPDIGARVFDANYAPVPSSYCGGLAISGCPIQVSATGQVSASGGGSLTLSVSGFAGPASGFMMLGLDPSFQSIPGGGPLCLASPRRLSAVFFTTGAPDCTGLLDLELPASAVTSLGAQQLFFQGAMQFPSGWRLTPAFETVVLP